MKRFARIAIGTAALLPGMASASNVGTGLFYFTVVVSVVAPVAIIHLILMIVGAQSKAFHAGRRALWQSAFPLRGC